MTDATIVLTYGGYSSSFGSGTISSSGDKRYFVVSAAVHAVGAFTYFDGVRVTSDSETPIYKYPLSSLPNLGIIPIENATLTVSGYYYVNSLGERISDYAFSFLMSGFAHPSDICFNGVELPNANITSISNTHGAKTWKISCVTSDLSLAESIQSYASDLKLGVSVSGYQYVISGYAAGELSIKYSSGFDVETKCYISGPIDLEIMGDNYIFDVEIIQSYYEAIL